MTTINQIWDFITGTNKEGPGGIPTVIPYDYNNLYDALYDMYNNDEAVIEDDTTRRLRTVVNRSVEFYASKMLPGKEIKVSAHIGGENDATSAEEKPNQPLIDAINQIIKDSNIGNNKPAMLRGFSLYGDSFIRVRGDKKKSYLEDITPFFITDFDEDNLGFLTYIRIDIPVLSENNLPENYTEVWDDETKTLRIWQGQMARTTPVDQLGSPKEEMMFSELGIDFIPIVHTKFKDNGDPRGQGCVYHALDKIYEANRIATRLHDLLFAFGEPVFVASANDKDAQGRPLPPPRVSTDSASAPVPSGSSIIGAIGQIFGRMISLPGMTTLNSLIPNIDYADALQILNAQMEELEKDLPELRWYAMSPTEQSAMSGKALRTLLGAAVDRANEARDNFLSSLSRAFEMALTIGIYNGVFPATLGTFDAGSFKHELDVDSAWGESVDEKAATMAALTGAGVPAKAAMKLAGFSEEEITEAFPAGVGDTPNTAPAPTTMKKGTIVKGTPPKAGTPVVRVG